MKKEMNKKLLIFSSVLLCLVFLELILISAQDPSPTPTPTAPYEPSQNTFMGRWLTSNLSHFDAKMILWLLMFILLLVILQSLGIGTVLSLVISIPVSFILVAYVTPDSIIGIFRSYDTIPLAFATFLPLAILFAITYLSVIKGSRSLMTTQWLLWLIYGILNGIKIILGVFLWFIEDKASWSTWTTNIRDIISFPVNLSFSEAFWFWIAIIIGTAVSAVMVTMGGKFMNWAAIKTAGLEDVAAAKKFRQAKFAIKNLAGLEKDLAE